MHQMTTPRRALNSRRSSWASATGSQRSSRSPSPSPSMSNVSSFIAPQPVTRMKTSGAGYSAGHGVHVSVRVRPFQQSEQVHAGGDLLGPPCFEVFDKSIEASDRQFNFDAVLPSYTTQQDMFETIGVPTMESFLGGCNSTIMAYGQTSAGKTYTMDGYSGKKNNSNDQSHIGLIPRCLQYLYDELHLRAREVLGFEWTVNCSFIEIYNEKVRDLMSGKEVQQQMNKHEEVIAAGLSKNQVNSMDEALTAFSKGAAARQTASTNMNDHSSRSHSVVTVELRTNEQGAQGEHIIKKAKLHFVDLAGSECVKTSGVDGLRQLEAANINKSLLALSRQIMDIVGSARLKKAHNKSLYRGSALTQYLRDSFGGSSKLFLIANVSPSAQNLTETVSTQNFAAQARKLPNKPVTNVSKSKDAGTDTLQAALAQQQNTKQVTASQIQSTLGMVEQLVQQNEQLQGIVMKQQRRLLEFEQAASSCDTSTVDEINQELQKLDAQESLVIAPADLQYSDDDWYRTNTSPHHHHHHHHQQQQHHQRPFSLDANMLPEFDSTTTTSGIRSNTNSSSSNIRPRQFQRNLSSNEI